MPRFFRFSPLLLLVNANLFAAIPFRPNYDESKVPAYTLPDPLMMNDGTRVRDIATWRDKRRPELLETFARDVYGRTPESRRTQVSWAVTSIDRAALDGKAVRKEVTIWFGKDDGPRMHLLIYQPVSASERTPAPAFLGLNFNGNQSLTTEPGISLSPRLLQIVEERRSAKKEGSPPTRGSSAASWEVDRVVARGYATATIYYQEICAEQPEGLTRDVGAVFGNGDIDKRQPDEWGAIGRWAWGLSRALDYLIADPEIDGTRVAVHGHSRLGKAALWAGAQDERFALVISNNSGCGGAALSRRAYGETLERINTRYPYWFCRGFHRYNGQEESLPGDQHQLVALIAPRPVYVASAEDDKWADPRGEFLSAWHAGAVYALFGQKGLDGRDMPAVNQPVHGDGIGYHVRTGRHGFTPYDWSRYLDFADRMLARPNR